MKQIRYLIGDGFPYSALLLQTSFELANDYVGHPFYQVSLHSEHGGMVVSSGGLSVLTEALPAQPGADNWIVAFKTEQAIVKPSRRLSRFFKAMPAEGLQRVILGLGIFFFCDSYSASDLPVDHLTCGLPISTLGFRITMRIIEQDHGPQAAAELQRRLLLC